MSPTQRSLAHLKALGYHAKVVEKWNPFAKIRQDLFGADVLALKPGEPVLVVQATPGSNHAARGLLLKSVEHEREPDEEGHCRRALAKGQGRGL